MNLNDVGRFAAQVMEDMERQFGADATVRNIAMVLDMDMADRTVTVISCDDDRPWVQLALLDEAVATIEQGVGELNE